MKTQIRPAIVMILLMTLLTGVLYPALITGVSQLLFPYQANGSLITSRGTIIGSELIGQNFVSARYFHPRPSAAGKDGYDAASSSGSNLGPTSRSLARRIDTLVKALHQENPNATVPIDMVTTSGSGLDPEITPAAAEFQLPRVARARSLPEEKVREILRASTESRQLGLLGEPRVNVLKLNIALDNLSK